tara:strand:- start:119 stop:1750 length:1632 start_codon:yes stop_codon:yes gene_type:complete
MIGGAIAKVFSGDFAGAAADVKGALSGIGDEIIEEANAAMRLKKELQALKDATRDLSLEKAKATQEIEKAMLITVDETATNEEKLEALKRALKLEKEVTEQSLALQQRRVLAIEEEVALGESLEEDFQKLTDERIRLIELETASIKMQKKVATQVLAFERKIEADRTAIIKTASDARKKIREQEKKDAEKLAKETADSTLKMSTNTANTLTNLYYTTLESAKEVELLKLEAARDAADKLIDESKATDEAKFSASLALFTKFNVDSKNITDKYDNLEDAAEQASADRLLSLSQNLTIALTEDANVRAIQVIELARRTELASVDGMANSSALKKAINKKYNAQVQAQDKATSDAKRKFEAADIAAIGGMFGQAASMQTEGTEGWKKNKEAEARIGSIMGAMSAYNSFATIPIVGVPLGLAAAGLALAQGQKQIEEIRATEIPKMAKGGVVGGYGSGTSDSVNAKLSRGEVVINAKSAKMFRGALSNMNVAGGGVGFARGGATTAQETDISSVTDFQNEPVKAFVITDDLTSSQDKLAQIRRRSRL